MIERLRIGVLISGRGSNMAALIAAAEAADYPARIAVAISNVAGAGGLELARAAGVAAEVVPSRGVAREAFEAALNARLAAHRVGLVCLAGFMRVLSPAFVARWEGRMLNIHPSLLPAFPGLDTHARALAAGVGEHGCTVHFVSAKVDAGPIVAQAAVPVLAGDTAETLAARVLAQEHRLYPQVVESFARGELRIGAATGGTP